MATTFVSNEQSGDVPESRVTVYGAVPPHHETVIVDCPEKETVGEHRGEYCCVVYVPLLVPAVVYCCVV